ncbi:MAG: exosortase family protein XrtG [Lachnospiraceae bacterium]|nr:exosortase family protein XrtG [Lachnospiraceae bacterium]
MTRILFSIFLFGAWIYLLTVLYRSKLKFWYYIVGAAGFFLSMMTFVRPYVTLPLARVVAALAGVVGNLTGTYEAFYKYGVIFINSISGSVSVRIDLECSGIIEISAFLALLAFFKVYSIPERIYVGLIGTVYTIVANALRLTLICLMIHFLGTDYYFLAHTFVGRIFFYLLQVILYFMVFTKPQVVRMKVGHFGYREEKDS